MNSSGGERTEREQEGTKVVTYRLLYRATKIKEQLRSTVEHGSGGIACGGRS